MFFLDFSSFSRTLPIFFSSFQFYPIFSVCIQFCFNYCFSYFSASLLFIETQSFIYVDLNCILHANAVVLSEWYRYFGNEVMARKYQTIANNLQKAIDNVS